MESMAEKVVSGDRTVVNFGRERISSLPEGVLSHILSLLPTKDAVRTSILSKDWEFKWTFVYNLTFNDESPLRYESDENDEDDDDEGFDPIRQPPSPSPSFISFVNRALQLCKTSTLNKFELLSIHKLDSPLVKTWISAVLRRNVRSLTLKTNSFVNLLDDSVFPSEFFSSSEFLTFFKLTNCSLKIPSNLCFSKLRSLNLSNVHLKKYDHVTSDNQQVVIFTMPVLEELELHDCRWKDVRVFKIDAPLLKKFHLIQPMYRFGHGGFCDITILICGGNLADVKCWSFFFEEFIISNPSTLVDACFDYDILMKNDPQCRIKMGFRACALLGGFSAVTGCLELSGDFIVVLSYVEPPGPLPVLDKLNHLKVSAVSHGDKFNKALVNLLERAPALKSLIISSGRSCEDDDEEIELAPSNFMSHLKVVKFQSFRGEEDQIQLVKFLLQHASVLEEMTFDWEHLRGERFEIQLGDTKAIGYEDLVEKKVEVQNQILTFPRSSSHVSIVFASLPNTLANLVCDIV